MWSKKPNDFSKMKSRERDHELARLCRKLENKAYKPDPMNFKEWVQDWLDIEAVAAAQYLAGHPLIPGTQEFLSRARALMPHWVDQYKLEIERQDRPPSVEEAGRKFTKAWENSLIDRWQELEQVPHAKDVGPWVLEWEQVFERMSVIELTGWQPWDFARPAMELLPDWVPPIGPEWMTKEYRAGAEKSDFDRMLLNFMNRWREHVFKTGHKAANMVDDNCCRRSV